MNKNTVVAMLALGVVLPFGSTYAVTPMEKDDLQERCGRQVKEWFTREWSKTDIKKLNGETMAASLHSHYSGTLNKCLMLLDVQHNPGKDSKQGVARQMLLFDVNDTVSYGFFYGFMDGSAPNACSVDYRTCQSYNEWNELVAQAMND